MSQILKAGKDSGTCVMELFQLINVLVLFKV